MATVAFKKGLLANLPSTYAEGTFYVTTDERAIYLDTSANTRIRLGDFQEFDTVADLENNTNPSTTALYYVKAINCLAKWDGSKYVQINLDTGATAVETTGAGNAITGVSYNAETRKLTFTKGTTFAVPSDINTAIANLDLPNTYDAKGDAAQALVDAKAYADGLAVNYDAKGDADAAKAAVIGKSTDAKTANTIYGAKAYADDAATTAANGKDTAIAEAKAKGEQGISDAAAALAEAQAKVASVAKGNDGIVIGGTATAPTVGVVVDPTAGNSLQLVSGKGLRVEIPAAAEYTVAKLDTAESGYAASYVLKKDGTKVGATINIPKDMVVERGEVVTNPAGQPAGTYIKLTLANATNDTLYINVGDLIEYVTSGSQTGDMVVINVSDDHKVTATITDGTITLAKLATAVQTEINKAHTHANKALLDTYTQTEANLADAVAKKHSHANAAELDKIATGDKAKWDTAATKAAANETAISGIKNGESINSFTAVETALDGKQDTIPANTYDAYGAASAVKTEVIGTNTDAKTANTIYGAKKYADSVVGDALTWGSF